MVATHQSSIKQAGGSSLPESYLTELSEPLQADYRAVISNGIPPSEQADRRNVNPSTVCTNVKRATTKLIQHWREERATPHSSDESGGYDIELVPVGGRNLDGSPAAISQWTFQTDLVRDRVCDHLSGRVLNACAGQTILPHSDVIRNDINSEMPNLDSQRDVTTLRDCSSGQDLQRSDLISSRPAKTATRPSPSGKRHSSESPFLHHRSVICICRQALYLVSVYCI